MEVEANVEPKELVQNLHALLEKVNKYTWVMLTRENGFRDEWTLTIGSRVPTDYVHLSLREVVAMLHGIIEGHYAAKHGGDRPTT